MVIAGTEEQRRDIIDIPREEEQNKKDQQEAG